MTRGSREIAGGVYPEREFSAPACQALAGRSLRMEKGARTQKDKGKKEPQATMPPRVTIELKPECSVSDRSRLPTNWRSVVRKGTTLKGLQFAAAGTTLKDRTAAEGERLR